MDYCLEYLLGWTSTNPSSLAVKCGNMRKQSMGFDSWSAGGWTSKESNAWIIRRVLDWNRWNHCPYAPCMVYLPLFTYIWVIFSAHAGKYSIHGASGLGFQASKSIHLSSSTEATSVTWSVETDKRKTCYDVRFPAKHEPIISQLIVNTYPLVNIQKTMENHHF